MFGTLTLLILILAVIITAQNITKENKNKSEQTPSPTSTITPLQTPTDVPTLIPPSSTPTPSPTPTPTHTPNNNYQSVLDFKYPNSTTISQNEKEATFESTDDPKKITDWYKEKIKSMGMNATSFVQTSTNGNILNKLVGGKSGSEVRVEITKQNNQPTVKISVTL